MNSNLPLVDFGFQDWHVEYRGGRASAYVCIGLKTFHDMGYSFPYADKVLIPVRDRHAAEMLAAIGLPVGVDSCVTGLRRDMPERAGRWGNEVHYIILPPVSMGEVRDDAFVDRLKTWQWQWAHGKPEDGPRTEWKINPDDSVSITLPGCIAADLAFEPSRWDKLSQIQHDMPKNWRRSPQLREVRRESVVYGNVLEFLSCLLGRRECKALRRRREELQDWWQEQKAKEDAGNGE